MKTITSLIRDITSWVPVAPNLREQNASVFFSSEYNMPRPFKPLPNVSEAKIVVNQMDPLLARGGIARKLSPDMEFKELSSKIKATNRYISIIQNKLERMLRKNQVVHFWVYALLLMKRSNALRLVALRKLQPNWHREMKLGLVKGIITRLNRDINDMATQLFISRDYVPKVKPDGSKSWRPVGVPSYPHRMYTYLLQSFIVMFVKGWISPSQHGFLPGRGVNTATAELTSLLEDPKFKYAFEFDLKGAFPSLIIPQVTKILKEIGFPPALADLLEKMSLRSVERVDLAPEDKKGVIPEPKFERQRAIVDEFQFQTPAQIKAKQVAKLQAMSNELMKQFMMNSMLPEGLKQDSIVITDFPEDHPDYNPLSQFNFKKVMEDPIPVTPKPDPIGFSEFGESLTKSDHLDMQLESLEAVAQTNKNTLEAQGFPQGLGTSPILFNIAFDYSLIKGHFKKIDPDAKVIAYADDFVVFSPNPLAKEQIESSDAMKEMGLVFNWEKSRMIKSDGLWLVDAIKFLGISYKFISPESTNILVQGTPKSGAILDYDKELTVNKFMERDESLRRFSSALNLDFSPQDLLDQWGGGLYPGAAVPLDIIQGKSTLTDEQAIALKDQFDPKGKSNQDVAKWAKRVYDSTKSSADSLTPTSGPSSLRHRKGLSTPLAGLRSRLKGLLINRLHGGSWEVKLDQPVDRSLKPKVSVEGSSWIERIQNVCVKTPSLANISHSAKLRVAARLDALQTRNLSLSIYNSTSYATLDLMTWTKDPKSMRLMKKGIRYN